LTQQGGGNTIYQLLLLGPKKDIKDAYVNDKLLQIRWHGRGGQGVVTAAKLLAKAVIQEGKYVQAFPEFGPERAGAPVKGFNRISDAPIRIHCQVGSPNVVVVLDENLIETADVLEGLEDGTTIIINTPQSKEAAATSKGLSAYKVLTVDASGIAIEALGKNIPNMPMLGALAKATGVIHLETLIETVRSEFSARFKPQIIEGNLKAIRKAYETNL